MSQTPTTRICPICHSLLWEEDFLRPEELEIWEEDLQRAEVAGELAGQNGHGGDPEAELLELAELLVELFLTLEKEDPN